MEDIHQHAAHDTSWTSNSPRLEWLPGGEIRGSYLVPLASSSASTHPGTISGRTVQVITGITPSMCPAEKLPFISHLQRVRQELEDRHAASGDALDMPNIARDERSDDEVVDDLIDETNRIPSTGFYEDRISVGRVLVQLPSDYHNLFLNIGFSRRSDRPIPALATANEEHDGEMAMSRWLEL
jgi:hypothetical protein